MAQFTDFEKLTQKELHDGHTYLLPHEVIWLEREVAGLIGRQNFHIGLYSEGMAQSSETDHDNAPVQAVASDNEVHVRGGGNWEMYNTYSKTRYSLLGYPVIGHPRVVPGSLVEVRFKGEDGTERYEIGGGMLLGERGLTANDDEGLTPVGTTPLSYKSPIGAALIGATVGEVVKYARPGGNLEDTQLMIELQVVDLLQDSLKTFAPLLGKLVFEGDMKNWHHKNIITSLTPSDLQVIRDRVTSDEYREAIDKRIMLITGVNDNSN